jgi:hypothetical protein
MVNFIGIIRDVLVPVVKEETRKTAEAWVDHALYSGVKKKEVPTVGYLPRDYRTEKRIRVIGPIVTIY